MIDLYECDPELIRDKQAVALFAAQIVKVLGMKAFGVPFIEKFGKPGTTAEGLTLVQLIETSAITAHFSDSTQAIYLDIFSCKTFNPKWVEEFAKKYFKTKKSKSRFTTRH